MATLGDPLMDLGGALAYWVQADDDEVMRASRRQPSHLPGMLTRAQIVEHYCARTGRSAGNWPFYEVFGLFRLAVIAQQIYYRYHHGQTTNPAFKDFWTLINYLDWRCRRVAGLE
jgi:aminoglycoside phosphotransferase (APT) family kinase protein